jgi:hypothetical protein
MLMRCLLLLIAFLALTASVTAHAINYALAGAPGTEVIGYYAKLGFEHIVPLGLDHVLFVAALCIAPASTRQLITLVTAFTLAHTVTLILSMQNVVQVSPAVVEPLIAFSIVSLAIENLFFRSLKSWRPLLVFVFGLLHGMGFAGALNETGLPPDAFFTALLSFNAGVEAGQLFVLLSVLLVFWMVGKLSAKSLQPLKLITNGIIAIVAVYWLAERLA